MTYNPGGRARAGVGGRTTVVPRPPSLRRIAARLESPTDRRRKPRSSAARSLRCRPQISGELRGDTINLRLGNIGPDQAQFTIYPFSGELPEPSRVEVLGEYVSTVPVAEDYWLAVHASNGFRFEFSGSRTGAAAGVKVQSRHESFGVALELHNNGAEDVTLRLRSLGTRPCREVVHVVAGGAQPVAWPTSNGCYDVEITCAQDGGFRRRISGHLTAD